MFYYYCRKSDLAILNRNMKSRQKKFKILFPLLLLGLFLNNKVLAADIGGVTLTNPLGSNKSIEDIIKGIANYAITLAGVIVVIMIIIGAFQILTAGGDPEKVKKGRHTILWSVVGFAIVLSAYGIAAIIEKLLE